MFFENFLVYKKQKKQEVRDVDIVNLGDVASPGDSDDDKPHFIDEFKNQSALPQKPKKSGKLGKKPKKNCTTAKSTG